LYREMEMDFWLEQGEAEMTNSGLRNRVFSLL
jgi:hypothetical protein